VEISTSGVAEPGTLCQGQVMSDETGPPPGRRLRIGIDAHVLGRQLTGNERVVSNLIAALRRVCDHELFIYLTDRDADRAWRARGYRDTKVRRLRVQRRLFRWPIGLPTASARDRIDVLLAHAHRPPIAPCPVVALIHDLAPTRIPHDLAPFERRYLPVTLPWSIRHSDAIIAVSEFTKREIVAVCGVPARRIAVAHNAVDPGLVDGAPGQAPVVPPYFLAVGNLQPRKNLETVIRAYRKASESTVGERLVIIGKATAQGSQVYEEAADLQAAGRVVFTGYVDDQTMSGALRGASAFVFPSLYEGFGLPPLEAMAAGAPVIASDIPATREVLGDAAMLVAAKDVDAWAEALRQISSDPGLRERLSVRGRVRSSSFSWEDSARIVAATLERVAAGGGS
jgi:glycosyltransferase involved in cell wall biosynthesis